MLHVWPTPAMVMDHTEGESATIVHVALTRVLLSFMPLNPGMDTFLLKIYGALDFVTLSPKSWRKLTELNFWSLWTSSLTMYLNGRRESRSTGPNGAPCDDQLIAISLRPWVVQINGMSSPARVISCWRMFCHSYTGVPLYCWRSASSSGWAKSSNGILYMGRFSAREP